MKKWLQSFGKTPLQLALDRYNEKKQKENIDAGDEFSSIQELLKDPLQKKDQEKIFARRKNGYFLQAVVNGDCGLTDLFLQYAATNKVDSWKEQRSKKDGNYCALHFAVIDNNAEMINLLLLHKADLSVVNSNLQTPLQLALSEYKKHKETNPNKKNPVIAVITALLETELTPLDKIYLFDKKLGCFTQLVYKLNDVTLTGLLIEAAEKSQYEWEHQFNVSDYNFYAVHYAVWNGNLEMLNLLLEKEADVTVEHNYRVGRGTPLQLAINRDPTQRDIKFISLLLQHDLTDNEKKSLFTSKNNYFLNVVADEKMDSTAKQKLVKLLLDTAQEYNINPFQASMGEQQQSALHLAVLNNDSELLKSFHQCDASFDTVINKDMKTALELALDDCLKNENSSKLKLIEDLLQYTPVECKKTILGPLPKGYVFKAISHNRLELARILLAEVKKIDAENWKRQTTKLYDKQYYSVAHLAIYHQNKEMLQLLQEYGTNFAKMKTPKQTAFQFAYSQYLKDKSGVSLELLNCLLSQPLTKDDLEYLFNYDHGIFAEFVYKTNDHELTARLIAQAEKNDYKWDQLYNKKDYNFYAGHYAVWHNNAEMLELLQEKEANFAVKHKYFQATDASTPLQLAIQLHLKKGKDRLALITLLLTGEHHRRLTDDDQQMVWGSKGHYLADAVAAKDDELVTVLLGTAKKLGMADWHQQQDLEKYPTTIIHRAVLNKDPKMLTLLHKYQADFSVTNDRKQTALALAFTLNGWGGNNDYLDCIKKLLEFSDEKTKIVVFNNSQCIRKAIDAGNVELAKVLLTAAESFSSNWASHQDDKYNQDYAVHSAVRKNKPELFKSLSVNGADFAVVNNRQQTALALALQLNDSDNSHFKCIKALLQYSDLKTVTSVLNNTHCILEAVKDNNDELAQLLLAKSKEIKAISWKSHKDVTALNYHAVHFAASRQNPKMMQLLHQHGADFEVYNQHDQTALELALARVPAEHSFAVIQAILGDPADKDIDEGELIYRSLRDIKLSNNATVLIKLAKYDKGRYKEAVHGFIHRLPDDPQKSLNEKIEVLKNILEDKVEKTPLEQFFWQERKAKYLPAYWSATNVSSGKLKLLKDELLQCVIKQIKGGNFANVELLQKYHATQSTTFKSSALKIAFDKEPEEIGQALLTHPEGHALLKQLFAQQRSLSKAFLKLLKKPMSKDEISRESALTGQKWDYVIDSSISCYGHLLNCSSSGNDLLASHPKQLKGYRLEPTPGCDNDEMLAVKAAASRPPKTTVGSDEGWQEETVPCIEPVQSTKGGDKVVKRDNVDYDAAINLLVRHQQVLKQANVEETFIGCGEDVINGLADYYYVLFAPPVKKASVDATVPFKVVNTPDDGSVIVPPGINEDDNLSAADPDFVITPRAVGDNNMTTLPPVAKGEGNSNQESSADSPAQSLSNPQIYINGTTYSPRVFKQQQIPAALYQPIFTQQDFAEGLQPTIAQERVIKYNV